CIDLERMAAIIAHGPVAKGDAAGVKAASDLTGEAAMGLVAQVVEVDFVDEPTHAAMEFASGRGRVVTVRATEDTNAAMLQAANDRFLFDLIAREAIEPFEEHHLEVAGERMGEKCFAAWPACDWRRAGNLGFRVH